MLEVAEMSSYSLRDVERLLGLSRAVVTGFIDAGFVAPARGEHDEPLFSFQDLVLLKAAQGLANVRIPTRRITQSLSRLRADLPPSLPLSGIRISAVGDRIVVQQGSQQWLADSGQYLLDFDVPSGARDAAGPARAAPTPAPAPAPVRAVLAGGVFPVQVGARNESAPAAHAPAAAESAERWFQRAGELEAVDPDAAQRAYRRAIELEPGFVAAWINLGCLLQSRGAHAAAENVYREAIAQVPGEPLLHFNLGIALEDLHRADDAQRAYEQAIALDPQFADAHYNLSRVHEVRGRAQDAIRHLAQYRRLLQG
jgi:tetratricopeptide (TPR) repeat protein